MALKRQLLSVGRALGVCTFVGIVPLAVLALAAWAFGDTVLPSRSILLATAASAALLVALAWLLAGRLRKALARAIEDLRQTTATARSGKLSARASLAGPGRELIEASYALNNQLQSWQHQILNLDLELKEATELREHSRDLIKECIYAREPLAKRHPGLANAYASAAIRQEAAGDRDNVTVDGLVHGVQAAAGNHKSRENLRWTREGIAVAAPVPSTVLNLSVSGMAVESEQGLRVGSNCVFRVGNHAAGYDLPGEVRWCRLDRTVKIADEVRSVYRSGVSFHEKLSGEAFEFLSPAAFVAAGARRP